MDYHGCKLDPFQEQAIKAIQNNQSVLVSAPTGAGKTLIAEYAIEQALETNHRIIYTAPIKALSNQKFRDFTSRYGNRIGILTGDVTINPDADALIMTTEIFRNTILEEPGRFSDVSYTIFDEVHYLDDEERGTVWEESIIFAPPQIKIIALSATIPNLSTLARWIRAVRNGPLVVITERERPVPLKHLLYLENYGIGNIKTLYKLVSRGDSAPQPRFKREQYPRQKGKESYGQIKWEGHWKNGLISQIIQENQIPCLYFLFSRQDCEKRAQENVKRNLLTPEEQAKVEEIFLNHCRRYEICTDDEPVSFLRHLVRHGVAFHHAGMLPSLKEIVEQLFTCGLIKLLFATETFAVGVNMPARSIIFDELFKFNGIRRAPLKSREYHQMAGRAGRRGIDNIGFVYSMVEQPYPPLRIIERVTGPQIEPVQSQFNLSYSCLLNLYDVLKDDIYKVCQKSFSNFQRRFVHQDRTRPRQVGAGEIAGQVRRRINLLERLDYIRRRELTRQGHFARYLYGSELVLTELFRRGILEKLTSHELAILSVALVFERKRREWYQKFPPELIIRLRRPVLEISQNIYRLEKRSGIVGLTPEVDFQLTGVANAWLDGVDFNELSQWTSADEGDIIRTFRRAVQVLHQLDRAYQKLGLPRSSAIKESILKLKRDEVDAEKYLRG